jgi:hypothetical protein
VQAGDILGPWLYEDMFKVLSLCRYRKLPIASPGFRRSFIGDARPIVPTGEDPCEFAYRFANENMSAPSDGVVTIPSEARGDIAVHRAQIGVRAWAFPDGVGTARRFNINTGGGNSVSRIAPFWIRGFSGFFGYEQGLPERVSASAKVYGYGVKRLESSEIRNSSGELQGFLTSYPVVPENYPDYEDNTWVEWTGSDDLKRANGTGFEFPVEQYYPEVPKWTLNLAGSPCPTVTGTSQNPLRNPVFAEYVIGSSPAGLHTFALLETSYTI